MYRYELLLAFFYVPLLASSSCILLVSASNPRAPKSSFLERLHADADLDKDGRLSFEECYSRILLFYIYVNRQADINPPSRQAVKALYHRAGWDLQKGLDADEFTRLARTLGSRAASRLAVHKIVTIIVAPVVALSIVDALNTTQIVERLYRWIPKRFPFYHQVTKRSFWVSVSMVLCIKQLPNISLIFVNHYLDARTPFATRFLGLQKNEFEDDAATETIEIKSSTV